MTPARAKDAPTFTPLVGPEPDGTDVRPESARSFTHGLPNASTPKVDSSVSETDQPETVDVLVSLLGPATDDFGQEVSDFRREVFELYEFRVALNELPSYGKQDWIRGGLITVAEALDELLYISVQVGERVRRGQVIGSWCGENILALESGIVIFCLENDNEESESTDADVGTQSRYGFPSALELLDQHYSADFIDAAVDHHFEWVVAIIAVDALADDDREPLMPPQSVEGESRSTVSPLDRVAQRGDRQAPEPMLIRHPRDAEEAATRWMRYWGWTDARTTPAGADEGIDVVATLAVAQVKAYMSPVGRPDVQNLFGVASAEKKSALFFALTDYTAEAKAWANKAGVGLFRFDLQGEPEPVNHAARQLISEQQARLDGAETTRRDEHPSV